MTFFYWLWAVFLVLCLSTAALFCYLLRRLWREHFKIVFINPNLVLFKRPCSKCAGGTQALLTRADGRPAWGDVPKELRREKNLGGNRGWIGPPLANVRNCRCCRGMGFHLAAKDEVQLPKPRWPL
jgi:hypothetical protein